MVRALVGAVAALALVGQVHGAERVDVPLKNWGGFALYRDAVYDDLERLVTAGLAGRTLLSTKPISRIEAARIVARAIEEIRRDADGVHYGSRRDLEPVLDRLAQEFKVELASLGVRYSGTPTTSPAGMFTFYPIDRGQVRAGYARRDQSFVNGQGLRFQGGFNSGATFESRLQVGDMLSFYLQPEFHGNEEYTAARLNQAYAKLTLFNIELMVGRENLWWGPGLRGSLILSNNAPPLDQVRIGSAEPFMLPLVGEWVGPTKLLFFIAQLEQNRDHPQAKLAGMRATVSPLSFLELGMSRVVMFDGNDRPSLNPEDYPRAIFYPPAGDDARREAKYRNNNLFAIDADLRFRNVYRYFIPARDLRLYGEFGWDDTCCATTFVPLQAAMSELAGIQALGLFGQEGLDWRFEFVNTSALSYVHTQFTNGYWTRGEVISHYVGTEGREFFSRLTSRFTPSLMLGVDFNRATVGRTLIGKIGPKETRTGGGIDLSWAFAERYALFGEYDVAYVTNRNFHAGDNGLDHLLRLELTRSFR